ncbi:hypothetical protein [Methylobacterium sp. WL8]|uniref:hypothetical protein n=1 Tax=Methylobacterium sp. WL8 TaxID=2603899 RepID=UPI0011CA9DB3|nr:hypothetical protein [Methylobacterium sp. WL8]TXN80658.1 hypothetical protein FV234_16110 [Methylobacterium sp. WL8]
MDAKAGSEPAKAGSHLSLVPAPSEKRSGGRRNAVMMPATIVCPDGATHPCVIRDMSATGAKLAISRRHRLPAEVTLAIPGQAVAYAVARQWQRGDFAGVVLAVAKPDADTSDADMPAPEMPAPEMPAPEMPGAAT